MQTAQQQLEAIDNMNLALRSLDAVHVYCHPDDEAVVRGACAVVMPGRGVVHVASTMTPGTMRLQRDVLTAQAEVQS